VLVKAGTWKGEKMLKELLDRLFSMNNEDMYMVLNEVEDAIADEYR